MKQKICIILIFLIIFQIIYPCCISKADNSDEDIYDVVLFWGQSNMTGYCGIYDNEKVADSRYDLNDINSIKNYSNKTGIDEDILSKSVQMNWVKVNQSSNTAYEYVYSNNNLKEINENTQILGEQLIYNSSTNKLQTASRTNYSIQDTAGTNVIPQFCKTYYEKTHHKVVAVLASNGGEKIANFLPYNDSDYGDSDNQMIYEAMVEKYKKAISCVQSKGYNIGNKLWVSFQGESDVKKTSKDEYKRLFLKVKNNLKNDLNITKGAIIETSYEIGESDLYNKIKNINQAQVELASENDDIIIGTSYSYDRYVPDESTYNSSSYSNKIFVDTNGDKLPYSTAFNYASCSVCYPDNTIHFTSAALSQMGKETAESLYEELRDKVAPNIQVNYSIKQPTNSNVEVTLTANEEIQEVNGWSLSSDKKNLTKIYQENAAEKIDVYDLAGNKTKVNVEVNNIDKTAPNVQVNYSTKAITNENITVTLLANEEVQAIEGWNLLADKKTLTKVYQENKTEEINVYDIAGNKTKVNVEVNNIDKSEPDVQVNYSTTKITNQNVIVTITSNKDIKPIQGWTLSVDKKKLTKAYQENRTEEVKVYDTAGNEKRVTIEVNNIDKSGPDVQVNYSTTKITNQDVIVTITANKDIVPIEGWEISADKRKLTRIYSNNINEEVLVYDIAGNSKKIVVQITNIDKKAPQIQVIYSETKATNKDVSVEIIADEEIQSLDGWTKTSDNKKLKKIYTENIKEKITISDIAGNKAEVNIDISNIDKTSPEVSINYSTKQITNKDILVTISSNKEIKKVDGWDLANNKKKLTKTYTSNVDEEVTIYDLVGNYTKVNVNISNIDKVKPNVNIEYSTKKITNENVEVKINSDKELQEVEEWSLSKDKKTLTKIYFMNNKEEVTVYDLAGNTNSVTIDVQNIDKNKPKVEVNYSTTKLTNKDVSVSIASDKELKEINGWEISKDKKILRKIYNKNCNEKIIIYDLAGNDIKLDIVIKNIDKEKPKVNINYSAEKNDEVEVKIIADKELKELDGWTISEDKKILTKKYYENTTEEIVIYDSAGNTEKVRIEVNKIKKSESLITANENTKTLPKVLPNAGGSTIIWGILFVIIISVIYYIKNKKMKDIK